MENKPFSTNKTSLAVRIPALPYYKLLSNIRNKTINDNVLLVCSFCGPHGKSVSDQRPKAL